MRVPSSLPRVLARIERVGEDHGIAFPWWIPIVSVLAQVGTALVALGQRHELLSPYLLAVLAMMAVPAGIQFTTGHWMPWWLEASLMVGAIALILSLPPHGLGAADFAPFALCLVAAEMTARDGWRTGLVVTVTSAGVLLVAAAAGHLESGGIHLLVLVLGMEIGYMFHWQARALAAEREARAVEHNRATLAERDRIAREIHDLVAHSLSVTMLQVTAARRILNDLPRPPDRRHQRGRRRAVRRRAHWPSGDVRHPPDRQRHVSIGGRRPPATHRRRPACPRRAVPSRRTAGRLRRPTVTSAGLTGRQPRPVPRHPGVPCECRQAPREAPAEVDLEVTARQVRLTVRNTRPCRPSRMPADPGTGLAGMKARVEQLGGHLPRRPWRRRLDRPGRCSAPGAVRPAAPPSGRPLLPQEHASAAVERSTPTRALLLVDDQELVRSGLSASCGPATDSRSSPMLRRREVPAPWPPTRLDVVVMDLRMRRRTGSRPPAVRAATAHRCSC